MSKNIKLPAYTPAADQDEIESFVSRHFWDMKSTFKKLVSLRAKPSLHYTTC
jgi:hypothetical protein